MINIVGEETRPRLPHNDQCYCLIQSPANRIPITEQLKLDFKLIGTRV